MRESLQRKLPTSQLRPITNTSYIGIKAKVESQDQYKQYLEELEGLRQELGVALREELYPQEE
jgi:hypothetical protein